MGFGAGNRGSLFSDGDPTCLAFSSACLASFFSLFGSSCRDVKTVEEATCDREPAEELACADGAVEAV